jgi:hypothetical protein
MGSVYVITRRGGYCGTYSDLAAATAAASKVANSRYAGEGILFPEGEGVFWLPTKGGTYMGARRKSPPGWHRTGMDVIKITSEHACRSCATPAGILISGPETRGPCVPGDLPPGWYPLGTEIGPNNTVVGEDIHDHGGHTGRHEGW